MLDLECHLDVNNFVISIVKIFFDIGVNLKSWRHENLLVSISKVSNLVRVLREVNWLNVIERCLNCSYYILETTIALSWRDNIIRKPIPALIKVDTFDFGIFSDRFYTLLHLSREWIVRP